MSELPSVQITQVGLRSTSKAEAEAVPANVTQFWAEGFLQEYARDPAAAVSRVIDTLSDDVYLTFDVDCCDPSWMPDTGTPEPGGLNYYQVRDILRAVCQRKRVHALDCVELIGGHPASAFATARLLYKTMGYLSEKQ